jgi:serine/threonine protein kinase
MYRRGSKLSPSAQQTMYQAGLEAVPSFKLVKRLGRGNFGEVWLATAPGGTRVALKILRLDSKGEREFYSLRLVKQIRHPNLMPIIAFWLKDEDGNIIADTEQDPLPQQTEALRETAAVPVDTRTTADFAPRNQPAELIVAMGLGDCSLYDRLKECQRQGLSSIPVDELLTYFEGAAQAIDHLNSPIHDLGRGPVAIQHRDVKPQNILIVGGAAQVCDYGLARSLNDTRQTSSLSAAYAAPESFSGEVSAHTDQYALAVSYFELRTGELPFRDTSLMGVVLQKREGKLDLDLIPEREREVIRKATAVNPADRYANCREMVAALREAVSEPPRPVAPKWVALAALILLLAVGGVLGVVLLRPPTPFLPPGTEPDEGARAVEVGGNWYYDRIAHPMPDGTRVPFVLVPATPGDEMKSFYIMENKVSNRLFQQFAAAQPDAAKESLWRKGPSINEKQNENQDVANINMDWPVFMTTAGEAHAFALWMGGRLPSARQWDKAAGVEVQAETGLPGPYRIPWDESSKTEIAVNRTLDGPLPAGAATADISPLGCRDMAGNGYEWTRSLIAPRSGYVPREFPDLQGEKENRDMVLLRGQSYANEEPLSYEAIKASGDSQPQAADEPKFDISFRVVIDSLP